MNNINYTELDNEFDDINAQDHKNKDDNNLNFEEEYDNEETYYDGFNTSTGTTVNDYIEVKEPDSKGIMKTIKRFATFSTILRLSGALIVIASMITFILKGWTEGNDINRYYMLLAQTFVLSISGFAISYLLKENKGARVFFGLGLLSSIANMTILGALIFSITQIGSGLAVTKDFATWVAADFTSLMLPIGLTLLVVPIVSIFGFMIFARNSAKSLTLLFIISNLLLLIPVRESFYVGIITIVGALLPILFIRKNMRNNTSLHTAEGKFALTTLFLPLIIIVSRSVWIYQIDALLQLILSAIGFALLNVIMKAINDKSFARSILEWLSVLVSVSIAITSADLVNPLVSSHIGLPIIGIVFAALTFYVSKSSSLNKTNFAILAGLTLSICNLAQIASAGSLLSSILCLASGIALIFAGLKQKERILLILGTITAVSGLGNEIIEIIKLVDLSNWETLAIIGISAIIIASIIERHGAVIKVKLTKLLKLK